jgi:S-adenosylmethionine decarboxylase
MNNIYVGRHLILDVRTMSKLALNDMNRISDFLEQLSALLDMTLVYPPIVAKFPFSHNELSKFFCGLENDGVDSETLNHMRHLLHKRKNEMGGVSGIAVWQESHTALHTFSEYNFFSFDAYSCRDFDIDLTIDFIERHFDVKSYYGINIIRSIDKEPKIKIIRRDS